MWKFFFEKPMSHSTSPSPSGELSPSQLNKDRVETGSAVGSSSLSDGQSKEDSQSTGQSGFETTMRILKKGHAMRVIFFYPGEEGTYVDNSMVTLYENGIVHLKSSQEETTTHLQNCEILWNFEVEAN